jgi:putative hydrolase of the HAD superfamily
MVTEPLAFPAYNSFMDRDTRLHTLRGALLLDWGNTLMREFPEYQGPMVTWPRIELLPHVQEVLSQLHPNYLLVIASNAAESDEAAIWGVMERAGLADFIDRAYCFKNVGYKKPAPEFFHFILDDLGLEPEQAIMVGDDFAVDVLGASRVGLRAIWLNERTDEFRSGPLYQTIHDFDELPAALG